MPRNVASAQSREDHLSLGKNYAGREQWKEAEEHLRIYRNANPTSAEATVLHARSLFRLNQPFDAVLELEELLKIEPDHVPALKLYAALLDLVVKDEAKAQEVLVRCSALAPDDLEVWKALGHHYLNHQKSVDAVRSFEQALRLAPADPSLVAGLAAAYGQSNSSGRARPQFARAVKLNERLPKPDPRVYVMYAQYLLKQNQVAASIPLFTKALLVNPHLSEAYYGRAVAHERLKDVKRAKADALAAIRESEKRRDAHQLLLRIARAENDPAQVVKYLSRVEELTEEETARQSLGRDLRALLRIAEPALREGRFAEAAKHYEEIIRLLPTFYEAYFALGVSHSQTGRAEQAEAALKKYLSFQPLSADGHAALGILLLQQNRRAEAKLLLEQAIRLDPEQSEARSALGWLDSQ